MASVHCEKRRRRRRRREGKKKKKQQAVILGALGSRGGLIWLKMKREGWRREERESVDVRRGERKI